MSTYFDLSRIGRPRWVCSGLINPHEHDRGGVDGLTGAGGVAMTERERRLGGLDFALRVRTAAGQPVPQFHVGHGVALQR